VDVLQGIQAHNQDSANDPLDLLPSADQAAFNASEKQHDPLCLADTRVEVLAEIRAWIYDVRDERCIFWLRGMAGTGKSTIARTIARELHDGGHLGASFFFSRGGGDVGHAGLFVTTIARQLATSKHLTVDSKQTLRANISKAVSDCPDIVRKARQDQWKILVMEPISRLGSRVRVLESIERMIRFAPPSRVLVIVLDALDECEAENDIKSILQLLAQARSLPTARLRVLVTSRPETPVYLGLYAVPTIVYRQLVLDDLSESTVNQDIRALFISNFDAFRISHGALPSDWPGDDKVDILVQQANALFNYAATVCRFISQDVRSSKERLLTVLRQDSAFQKSLSAIDDIYIKILQQNIPEDCDEDIKTKLYQLFDDVVKPVVVLSEPLSVSSLACLVQADKEDVIGALKDLRSILYLPANQGSTIRLLHPTFREFLLDQRRCTNPRLATDETRVHYNLFKHCLRVMSNELKHYMCGIRHPAFESTQLDKQTLDEHIPLHLQYACRHWVAHLLHSDRVIDGEAVVISFLIKNLLFWLEALCWMGRVTEAMQMITELEISVVSKSQPSIFCTQLTCAS
jgi:hypothetical protein